MIIAIDGPAASGKGTLGKRLAAHYGLPHLDTGLIYRAVAKALLDAGHSPENRARALAAAEALDPSRFDEAALKSQAVGEAASLVSAVPEVRKAVLAFQRNFGRTAPGAVLDGRSPPESGAGSALARHHAFGYRRRVPGRHRHRRSRPSRPETRLTAFPSMEDEPAPPASLMAHGHEIIVLIAGSRARTVARRPLQPAQN